MLKKIFQLIRKEKTAPLALFFPIGKKESQPFMKEGWRNPEGNRQWSVGHRARITVSLQGVLSDSPLFMVCKLSAFVVAGIHEKQRMFVEVNQVRVGELILSSKDFVTKVFTLPSPAVLGKELSIVFQTPDCISPSELGMSPDPDKLGVCVFFLAIVNEDAWKDIVGALDLRELRSMEEYSTSVIQDLQVNNERFVYESILAHKNLHKGQWTVLGSCGACLRDTSFAVCGNGQELGASFREQLICDSCGLKNRQRIVVDILRRYLRQQVREASATPKVFLYERVGAFYQFLSDEIIEVEVVGSEYLGPDYVSGREYEGVQHEDALSLSFPNQSFDIVISCDVFEHVPDIAKALAEVFRIMKNSSVLYFTVPFDSRKFSTGTRARLKGQDLEFLCDPVYHGNPIDENGALVFYDFSWDILDACKKAGFKDAYVVSYWGAENGYLGVGEQFVFVAEK